MPRKPAHEQFDTLKVIGDRAFELFGRYGYEGVSIGDIATAAKLSKGALYWHFQGKEALYLDCLKRLHTIFDSYIFDVMRAEPDPVKAVVALFGGLSRLLQDPRIEKGIGGYWLIPDTPETVHIITAQRAFESAAIAVLHDALKRGQQQGSMDLGGDLDDMARAIISLVEACVLPLRHLTPDEVNRQLGVLARTLFRAYAKSPELVKLVAKLG
ncbi:TetR/AcrR family transcriptional regulator [Solimonas fluminis]|uniref:TetR/AcrR family transcriptional regulator n=1 Tax=Solimonas fluminis TaxID=2086571 RepID=A0A2S5TDP5_9GAMM|nr:TetR/AcrR family transcriptional regulator [Solimonas fluminis]PPE73105.1 TetR/AcrR family transcriptional regulator [Solimonas fluminis]